MIGDSPGRSGSSVNGAVTRTPNDCDPLRPAGVGGLRRIVARPTPTAVTVTRAPDARAVTRCGADDEARTA